MNGNYQMDQYSTRHRVNVNEWVYLNSLSNNGEVQHRADNGSSGAPRRVGHHEFSRVEKFIKWSFVAFSWAGLLLILVEVM